MRKTILTPEQCANLIPHWYELDQKKLDRISRMNSRTSKLIPGQKINVMSSPGILIDEEGYIINGKHRAVLAVVNKKNTEAYIVKDNHDIEYHTPKKAYGEGGLDKVLEAYDNRHKYIAVCNGEGIHTVADLVKLYNEIYS